MEKTSKQAGDFMEGLGHILRNVQQLKELNHHFKQFLAPEIADYCFVTSLLNNKLTVLTASGSIATQIRFESYDLIRKFKTNTALKKISSIETKVRPQQAVSKRVQKSPPVARLSAASSQMIEAIAHAIDDDKLKKALLRIASYRE